MPEHLSSLQQVGVAALVLAAALWVVILVRLLRRWARRPGVTVEPSLNALTAPPRTEADGSHPLSDPTAPADRLAQTRGPAAFAHRTCRSRGSRYLHAGGTAQVSLHAMPRQNTPTSDTVPLTPEERAVFDELVRRMGEGGRSHQP
ncbi:hypothetical protein JNUCC64_13325 [Streptomyces sp. JNUCC 64]